MGDPLPPSPDTSVASIRVVTALYAKMLDSHRLHRHFDGVSMEGLVSKLSGLIDSIARDGTSYTQDDLHRVHAHLRIDDDDFDEMLLLLDIALREQRMDPEPGNSIKQVFASFRDAIVKQDGNVEARAQAH